VLPEAPEPLEASGDADLSGPQPVLYADPVPETSSE
jgi:hypothetical protein